MSIQPQSPTAKPHGPATQPPERGCQTTALYRPRRPQRTTFYRLLEEHFDDYVCVHLDRFEPRHGALRRVVSAAVLAFLDCGRYQGGFARLRCASCRCEHLIAFSCQTRNFCPSCQAKRATLFGEFLAGHLLAPVSHRHVIFTIPKALRGLFERDRRLLGILARSAHDAIKRHYQEVLGHKRALPGMVSSIQTFGSYANFHPHIHALVTAGLLERGGRFHSIKKINTKIVEQHFRRLVLARLRRGGRLSESFHHTLLSWEHSGFSVYAGEPIARTQKRSLERMARYMTRAPVALHKVSCQEDGRVKLLTPRDPKTGQRFVLFDPLDWVHAVTMQIPDTGQHLVRYQGAYANAVRRRYRPAVANPQPPEHHLANEPEDDRPWVKQRRRSWARLLRRIYEVDPLVCPCGGALHIVAVITDPAVIDRILAHRRAHERTSPFAARAPPAA